MLKAVILIGVLAIVVATFLTQSFLAPPIGAAALFVVLFVFWLFNRGGGRGTLREAEEATHRQREEGARGDGEV